MGDKDLTLIFSLASLPPIAGQALTPLKEHPQAPPFLPIAGQALTLLKEHPQTPPPLAEGIYPSTDVLKAYKCPSLPP